MRTHFTKIAIVDGERTPVQIPAESITHFKADAKYVEAYYADGMLLTNDSLRTLRAEFGEQLVQIHRSTLARKALIREVWDTENGRGAVRLDGVAQPLAVSRNCMRAVRRLAERTQ